LFPPSGNRRRAVFFDRDGVINASVIRNGKPFPPDSIWEMQILPGVKDALVSLRNAGYLNIIVTNQPDIRTGKQSIEVLVAMHRYLESNLAIDHIEVCSHVDADICNCRKPGPGMLLQAAARFGIEISASYLVGDRWRDIEAGQRAGCKANYFIDYRYAERRPVEPFVVVDSALQAAQAILLAEIINAA